jgi:hypothetical protein
MSDPQTIRDLPGEIVQQCETGAIPGSCDWGHCHGEQVGWGYYHGDDADDWLAICAEHLGRGDDQEYPVTASWTFAQVEAILGWPEGAIRGV